MTELYGVARNKIIIKTADGAQACVSGFLF